MTSAITNPATVETVTTIEAVTPVAKKRITIKEYIKSLVFLIAIYSLIVNQVQHDKTDNRSTAKKINPENVAVKKAGRPDLFSLFYSGTSIILYPVRPWK